MKAHSVLGSPPFIMLGVTISRLLPKVVVHGIVRVISRWMAWRRTELFTNCRNNQRRLVPGASEAELDRLAQQAIYHAGVVYRDMFRLSQSDYQHDRVPISMDQDAWRRVLEAVRDDRGTVLVGPHTSNYDLAAYWIASHGVSMQALSLPDPNQGTRVVNALRRRRGVDMTPLEVGSLRQALQRLRKGGVVLTGVDRPVSSADPLIPFFGEPARIPSGPARLALQSNSRVVVACCHMEPDGGYRMDLDLLEMESTGNRKADVMHNTKRIMVVIEDMIRQIPEQWLMFVPVWDSPPCEPES